MWIKPTSKWSTQFNRYITEETFLIFVLISNQLKCEFKAKRIYLLIKHWIPVAYIRLQRSKCHFNLVPTDQYPSMLSLKDRVRPWKMCLILNAPFWVWIFSSITGKAHHSGSSCGILCVNNYFSNTEDSPWGWLYSLCRVVSLFLWLQHKAGSTWPTQTQGKNNLSPPSLVCQFHLTMKNIISQVRKIQNLIAFTLHRCLKDLKCW